MNANDLSESEDDEEELEDDDENSSDIDDDVESRASYRRPTCPLIADELDGLDINVRN